METSFESVLAPWYSANCSVASQFDRRSFRSKPKVSSIEDKGQFDRRVNVKKLQFGKRIDNNKSSCVV